MIKFDHQLLLAKLCPSGVVPTTGLFFFQEIAMLRAEARQRLEIQRQQSQFLRNEVNNNREIEAYISIITRSSIRMRDDYNKLLKTVDELTNEVSKLLYRHKFLTEVCHEITVFLNVTPSSLGNGYQHFGGTCTVPYLGHIDCAGILSCQQMLVLQYSMDFLTPKSIFLFGDTHQRTYDSKIKLQHLGLSAI